MDMTEAIKLANCAPIGDKVNQTFGKRCEYVTAWLSDAEYGFESARVEQIRRFDGLSVDADSPGFVVGKVGLAGSGIPVVDLRLKQGPAKVTYSDSMLVVVVATAQGSVGVVVDSISDLVDVEFGVDQIRGRELGMTFVDCKAAGANANSRKRCALRIPDINQIM